MASLATSIGFLILATGVLALSVVPVEAWDGINPYAAPINTVVLQKGTFNRCTLAKDEVEAEYTPDEDYLPDYDACKCTADITYPALGGAGDARPAPGTSLYTLNKIFKQEALGYICEGANFSDAELARNTARGEESTLTYEVLHRDDKLISIKYFASFLGDGATGSWRAKYIVGDLKTGHVFTQNEVFDSQRVSELNAYIYQQLLIDPKLNPKRVESLKKNGFVILPCEPHAGYGRRVCRDWFIDKDGFNLTFESHEISYGAGAVPVIAIPSRFLADTPIRDYVTAIAQGKKPH